MGEAAPSNPSPKSCDGHNSSSSGNGGGPFFSFTRSPHRLFVRALSDAQETAFEQLRLHLKLVSEGEEELPTDFIRQLGNLSPKLKITLDLISRDPSKYLRSIWFLPLVSKSSEFTLSLRRRRERKAGLEWSRST